MDDVPAPPPEGGSYFPPPPYTPYPPSIAPEAAGTPAAPTPSRRRRVSVVGLAIAGGAFALLGAGFLLGRAASSGGPASSTLAASTDLASAGLSGADPVAAPSPAGPGCNGAIKHGVAGTLKSHNGNTLTITPGNGGNDVKVTTNDNTKITKLTSGSLSDITSGALVTVHGSSANSGISADQVGILPAGTNLPNPPMAKEGALEQRGLAFGKVTSVSDGGFVVQEPDNSTVNVTTSSSTKVVKITTASVSDLTDGQPIVVLGTTNPDGSVTAVNIVQSPEGLSPKGLGPGFGPWFGRFGHGRFGNGSPSPNAPSVSGSVNPTA